MRIPRGLTFPTVAILAVFGAAPLLLLTVVSFFPEGPFSLAAHRQLLPSGGAYPLLVNSLLLATGVAFLATAVGLGPGVVLARTDFAHKTAWSIVFALPLLLPPILVAAGWQPWVATWLELTGGSPTVRFVGACAVLVLVYFPVPLFLTALAARRTDASLEDVARLAGGGRRALRMSVLTLARPGVSLGWLLVFLFALSDVSVPQLFGFPTYQARLGELATFEAWRQAGAAAFPLILAALVIAAGEAALFGERGVAFLGRSIRIVPRTIRLGAKQRVVRIAFVGLTTLALGLPVAGWIATTFSAGTGEALNALAVGWREGGAAFARSLVFAFGGGTAAVLLGAPLAYAAERQGLARRSLTDLLLVLLFVVPGPVLGLGLLHLLPFDLFRDTAAALVLGYGVHLAAVPYRMERVALQQLGPGFEEAGLLAGASWSRRVHDLLFPINLEFLGAIWLGAVLLAFRDGGVGLTLAPAEPTLAALGARGGAGATQTLGALSLVAAALATALLAGAAVLVRAIGIHHRRKAVDGAAPASGPITIAEPDVAVLTETR